MPIHPKQFIFSNMVKDWSAPVWEQFQKNNYAKTVLRNGDPVACAGLTKVWHGRAIIWGVFSQFCNRYDMLHLYREGNKFISKAQEMPEYRRIETTTHSGNPIDIRWVEKLGFYQEAVMPAYDAMGDTHYLYSKINMDLVGDIR